MIKLITMIVGFVPALFAAIIGLWTRKFSVFAATSVAMIGVTLGFIACINLIVTTIIALAVLPVWAVNGIGFALPGDFALCLGAIVSARICRAGYDLAVKKLGLFNNAQ